MLLSEFLELWLSIYSCRLKPHSVSGYKVNIKHINSFLGDRLLDCISTSDIQIMYSRLLKMLKGNTVLYIHRTLHESLEYAVDCNYIIKNPCKGVIVPKKERFSPHVIDEFEARILLENAKSSDYDLYIVLLLAISLGLRRGEIIGLKFSDIDHGRKTITVSRTSEVKYGTYVDSTPKTDAGNRTLLLSSSLYDVIMSYWSDCPRICRLSQDQITYRFKHLLKELGFGYMRFHDLRHSCATLLLKKGIPAKIVSERLGHSSITVTLDLYSHVLTTMQEPAALAFDSLI